MSVTIAEVKDFIEDAKKFRESWLTMANRSWSEIKKTQKNNRLWSVTPNSLRRRARYPAWYSIFKIRQPLLLSRIGIPICKDTTQDGNDKVGAVAAIIKERLAINLAKDFDFFEVLSCARDDFLATNFGILRAYYERDEIKEKFKERLTTQIDPETNQPIFINAKGQVVESDDIAEDSDGFFLETEEIVDVTNERIRLCPVLYKEFYVDPDVRRWSQVKRVAFCEHYSPVDFKRIFGVSAYNKLPKNEDPSTDDEDTGTSNKRRYITVYEYWDKWAKKCYWLPENSDSFVAPNKYYVPDESDADDQPNGLYDLAEFFPVPPPMMMNQATDEFWPVPEYYQIVEILDDIHTIFSRMASATRSIRTRLLFDANVDGLQQALNEAAEGDAFGVPNLAQSLNAAGGTLEAVVQYIPVEQVINGLNQLYTALEQRLNVVYKLTGTSDLLQGLITDPTQRTFGERQMTEKYALNQIADPQQKMVIFVKDCYELMCEMALKNFKDETLDKFMLPKTLQPDEQAVYRSATDLLKNQNDRFRIDLETDSTIALNEEYDKQVRIELVNALTTALEKTANIAQTSPALVVPELHCLKYLIQGFRQGKMFQSEVTQAIDNVIQAAQASAPPSFNKDEQQLALRREEVAAANQLKQYEIQSNERLEMAKLQQNDTVVAIKNQLDSLKAQQEQLSKQDELRMQYEKLQADIALQSQELALKREQLALQMQELASKNQLEQVALSVESQQTASDIQYQTLQQQIEQADLQLRASQQELEAQAHQLDLQERVMTEQRLQAEQKLKEVSAQLELATKMKEVYTPPAPALPAINVHMPKPAVAKKAVKIVRDPNGEIVGYEHIDDQGNGVKKKIKVNRDEAGRLNSFEQVEGDL